MATATKNKTNNKLYRSENNKVIAGVCAGLAEYFDIDPIILRVLLIVITLFGGSGLLLYIILWVVMPTKSGTQKTSEEYVRDNVEELKEKSKSLAGNDHRPILGIIFVVIGISLLLENFGFYALRFVWRLWPLIFVAVGIAILAKKK